MRELTKQELNLRHRLTKLLRGVQNEIVQKAFDECYLMQECQKRYAEFSPSTLIGGRHVILLNHDFFESSQEDLKVNVVFHEIAHCFKRHTGEEDKRQEEEKEACELAKQWTAEWKKQSGD